jgi:hypothetical protein
MNRIFERFMVSDFLIGMMDRRWIMFASGCYGGGYPVSTAACGEGTIDICHGAASNAYALTFRVALAYANINDHSLSKSHAYTSTF